MTTGSVPDVQDGAGPATGQRALWRIRAWRYAFPAAVASRLGDLVFDITVVLWIATGIAKGQTWAPAAVSGVLIAASLPIVIVGPIAGVYADRRDRHQILVRSNAVQAASVGSLILIPILGDHLGAVGQLIWIYGAILVCNAAGQFFMAARLPMIAKTIPDELRTLAFSVQGSANSLMTIIGPPLAAPLLFTFGVSWALGINALSFVASSLLLARVSWDSAPDPSSASQGFWESTRDGARAVAENRMILAIVVAVTVVTLGSAATNVLDVFFVTDVLHSDADLLGVIGMAFASGVLVGAISAPWIERRINAPRIFIGGVVLMGVLDVCYSRTTSFPVAFAVFFVAAVPLGVVNTVLSPLAIRSIPPEMLGRSLVLLSGLPAVASLTAIGITGWLASTVLKGLDINLLGMTFGPIDTVFTIAGLLTAATGLLVAPTILRAQRSG